ncbi:restriction endonuclease subunit S [Acinetobacter sp. NEB 394]|jgi:type I restriction enzyme S subunit|uniref:restriction endonuclease subunit S n=1 Tax=Acinetobacter sp. NEB 394 TaxID=2743575 RepID=UPI001596B26B|nr:restriction endonuclease subunit S [Acinetobacter sp. NEB 394]
MTVPKLRFKEFDGGWTKSTIQFFMDNNFILDQMDGNHGELYPKSEEFSATGVPYISATDFSFGDVNFATCKRLPIERAKLFKKGIAKNGDVLFAHNATVGPVAILKTDLDFVILSTTATYYRCEATYLNNHYLKNYFESDFFVQQYFGIMSQSTRNQVPITTQRKLNIAVPNIQEQTKIASFLSAVDEKISQLTQKHELLSQYKQGMMQKLFSQQLRFKADDGSEFGEWENSYIGNECKITTGNKDTQNKVDDGLYPFFVRSQTVEKINSYSMDCEAILTSGDGVGVGKNYHYMNGKFDFHQRVYCLYEFSERLIGRYLYIYFSNYFYDRVKRLSAKNSVDSVRMDMISKMEIKLPCLEEQTKIANFLSAIDQKIEVVAQQIEQAKTWKTGLLQQMFV